jgi:hypothetical protein
MKKHTSADGVRFYEKDGEYFPSSTTILECFPLEKGLRDFFLNNTKEQADKLLHDAALQGSKIHHAIELMLLGESINPSGFTRKQVERLGKCEDELVKYLLLPLTDKEDKMLTGFENWWEKFKPITIYSEKEIHSPRGYAGTMDWMGTIEIKGERVTCIVDWKTGKGLYKSYDLQVSSYVKAIEEMEGVKIEKAFLLQLGLNKCLYKFQEIKDIDDSFLWFLETLKVWQRLHPNAKPKQDRIKLIHKIQTHVQEDTKVVDSGRTPVSSKDGKIKQPRKKSRKLGSV